MTMSIMPASLGGSLETDVARTNGFDSPGRGKPRFDEVLNRLGAAEENSSPKPMVAVVDGAAGPQEHHAAPEPEEGLASLGLQEGRVSPGPEEGSGELSSPTPVSEAEEEPSSARSGEGDKALSEAQVAVPPEGQAFHTEPVAVVPARIEQAPPPEGPLKVPAPDASPEPEEAQSPPVTAPAAAATDAGATSPVAEGAAPGQRGALSQARPAAGETPSLEAGRAAAQGAPDHAGEGPAVRDEAGEKAPARTGMSAAEQALSPAREAVDKAWPAGSPGGTPSANKDVFWQTAQPGPGGAIQAELPPEPGDAVTAADGAERREALRQAGPYRVVLPDDPALPDNEMGNREPATPKDRVAEGRGAEALRPVAPQQAAPEWEEGAPEWLAQIEHGRRWQQASESGKMLPPEPAVAAAPMMPRAASGRGALVDFSSIPGAEPEPDNVSLRPTVAEGEPVAPPADNRVPIPETVLPVAAGSRDGAVHLLPPERSGPAERALALQGAPEQNARQLAQQVQVMVSQDLREADIRLSPSELGGLRIQLKMEQGEVNIQFLASQPQARELLDQALPRLREMLVQQGLTLGQGQVGGFNGQQGAQQQAAGGERGDRGEHGSVATEGNGSSELADVEPDGTRLMADGRIDFFA